jgi:hypothetical protein
VLVRQVRDFGRPEPNSLPSLTVVCPAGLRVIGGGVVTSISGAGRDDLMRVQLLFSGPTSLPGTVSLTAWTATSVVVSRLAQDTHLIYTVTAFCIPGS